MSRANRELNENCRPASRESSQVAAKAMAVAAMETAVAAAAAASP